MQLISPVTLKPIGPAQAAVATRMYRLQTRHTPSGWADASELATLTNRTPNNLRNVIARLRRYHGIQVEEFTIRGALYYRLATPFDALQNGYANV